MYEGYIFYIIFFFISSVIFTFIGIVTRYYTGKDWYKFVTKIIVIVVMIVVLLWTFTSSTNTSEELLNNLNILIWILLYVFFPLIIGEVVSSVIYNFGKNFRY